MECDPALPPLMTSISTLLPWRQTNGYRLASLQFTYHKTTSFSIFQFKQSNSTSPTWPGQLDSFFSP
ncbi:hypothetical protein IMY05_010G0142200 [Salix suchowensis]|nr:hypothetical protein IMY05_010G0142200 [Salix suchowensis]